jgi:hypothetical protein
VRRRIYRSRRNKRSRKASKRRTFVSLLLECVVNGPNSPERDGYIRSIEGAKGEKRTKWGISISEFSDGERMEGDMGRLQSQEKEAILVGLASLASLPSCPIWAIPSASSCLASLF